MEFLFSRGGDKLFVNKQQVFNFKDKTNLTFAFALIVIYLALAALFESFRDPLVILVTVPLAVCGTGISPDDATTYDEVAAARSAIAFPEGWRMMSWFLG